MVRNRLVLYTALVLLAFLTACSTAVPTETPEAPPRSTPASTADSEAAKPTATSDSDPLIMTRVLEPTATADLIAREVTERIGATELGRTSLLGIPTTDWINLGISFVFVLAGYAIGTLLVKGVLPPIVRRSSITFDERLLKAVGSDLRWLVVVTALYYATVRLVFLSASLKILLEDLYFVLGLAIALRITWRTIELANAWYRERLVRADRLDELEPVVTLSVRLARLVVVVTGLIILLSHFGINVTAFAAALGIGGLALSLAAQDTLADTISGFIILVDRPFRVGDRIEIQGVGTWGDVMEIGLRTTRIRTRDNRMVITPNSIIGTNQVINYTYPDPRYRIETHVGIPYGTDIDTARHIIIDTVQQVPGVLLDQPVDALYVEMGDSAMIFRVRWWIESYVDTRRMFDRVHTAVQKALDEAGIETPVTTYDVNLNPHGAGMDRPTRVSRE